TMNTSDRRWAPTAPPVSGASTRWWPVAASLSASSRLAAGDEVDRSRRIVPAGAASTQAAATPATSSRVGSDVSVISLAAATAAGARGGGAGGGGALAGAGPGGGAAGGGPPPGGQGGGVGAAHDALVAARPRVGGHGPADVAQPDHPDPCHGRSP